LNYQKVMELTNLHSL